MPYIKQEDRERLEVDTEHSAGELNYSFTRLALNYLEAHGTNYQVLNDILGALDGASKEFYRRVVAPYEDKKIKENGDVYV